MITIDYFSDVLCVWAYGGQVRLDELEQEFGDRVLIRHRFMSLFADTRTRIGEGWQEQGGFSGFGQHMQEVCAQWPHTHLHADAWVACRPRTCTTAHVFLKAVGLLLELEGDAANCATAALFNGLVARTRQAFFEQGRDIGRLDELLPLLGDDLPAPQQVRVCIDNGEAFAALQRDEDARKAYGVVGSPTYVFNEGRQLLYGNVGYRIIEANIRELMSSSEIPGAPSWC
jgi:predicted DsbA family dithiol-disulfide isomerase